MSITIPEFTPRRRATNQPSLHTATDFYAYLRVSTRDQAEHGHGLDASRTEIERWAAANGKNIIEYRPEAKSGKDVYGRAVLLDILDRLARGEGHGIVVSKLDRLARSIIDFAMLLGDARTQGWAVAALDVGIDMSTPHGEMIATFMIGIAQWERRIIGLRTREGLDAARAKGVRLGRPPALPDWVFATIIQMVEDDGQFGQWSRIARKLNADNVPTSQGGKQWYPHVVRTCYFSQRSVDVATEMASEGATVDSYRRLLTEGY